MLIPVLWSQYRFTSFQGCLPCPPPSTVGLHSPHHRYSLPVPLPHCLHPLHDTDHGGSDLTDEHVFACVQLYSTYLLVYLPTITFCLCTRLPVCDKCCLSTCLPVSYDASLPPEWVAGRAEVCPSWSLPLPWDLAEQLPQEHLPNEQVAGCACR